MHINILFSIFDYLRQGFFQIGVKNGHTSSMFKQTLVKFKLSKILIIRIKLKLTLYKILIIYSRSFNHL